jgi:diamine N-acetyltransferase
MSADEVTLREITRETLRAILKLKVAAAQERFVASNAVSIAQAHFYPGVAWFRGIYADDEPVGFVMLELHPDKQEYGLWRFMIDERYQGHGYGAQAIALVVAHVRGLPGAKQLLTSVVPGEGSPGPFYQRLGFEFTGEVDEGEQVLRLAL